MPQLSETYSNWDLIRDLWQWLGKYRTRFVFASLLLIASEISWLYPTYALAKIVTLFTRYGLGVSKSVITGLLLTWASLSVFRYVSQQVGKFIAYQIGERLSLDMELLAVRHVLQLDLAWHERGNVGNTMKRIQRGSASVEAVLDTWTDSIIPMLIRSFGPIAVLATIDRTIALATAFFLVSYYALSQRLMQGIVRSIKDVNQGEEDASGLEFQLVNNIRTVKALGFANQMVQRLRGANEALFVHITSRIRRWRTRDLIAMSWGQLFRLGLLTYVIERIFAGTFEAGFLILAYNYFSDAWESLGRVADLEIRFAASRLAVARLADLLREPIGIEAAGKKQMPASWQSIELRGVSFSYGEREVLSNLSFTIKRGERIGIVGLSGAGKSTLFKLLLKEYEHYSGEILVDTTPLRQIKRLSYVQRAAVVLQDTEVFNFPLKENVTIASTKKAGDAKLLNQALKIAHVTDFVGRLPDGIETMIGEKGVKLSGGERQRVGIARAVFKQPDILFMDEATSHLDSESEQKIQDSLHQVFKSVTAVVIAHRLSTIREMDRILVLEDGKLIEEGSFDALLKKKGRFHQLWQTQQF